MHRSPHYVLTPKILSIKYVLHKILCKVALMYCVHYQLHNFVKYIALENKGGFMHAISLCNVQFSEYLLSTISNMK